MNKTLKNCRQCGHKTTRDFCTPQCRMEDSDNRIEDVEEERDKYKAALEKITTGKISWSKPENMGKTVGEVFQEIAEGVLG